MSSVYIHISCLFILYLFAYKSVIILGLGTYRWTRAAYYVVSARRLELQSRKHEFKNHAAFIEAVKELPQDLMIRTRHMTERPDDWCDQKYGKFPDHGVLIVYCKLPSAHRSMSNR